MKWNRNEIDRSDTYLKRLKRFAWPDYAHKKPEQDKSNH